jgi:lysophospholipase L1-like esterase
MKKIALALVLVFFVVATAPTPEAHGQGGVSFSIYVAIGDSLTAGFQDGAMYSEGQQTGFVVHVSESTGLPVALPLIAAPGIPTPNPSTGTGRMIQRPGTCALGEFDIATGQTTGRLDPTAVATNLGIPGQNMQLAIDSRWSIDLTNLATIDSAEDFVLGFPYVLLPSPANTPRSQIETALGVMASTRGGGVPFVTLWLGSNDALGAALAATVDDTTLTPVDSFNASADTAFGMVASSGCEAAVMNVPDVTVIANLFSEPELEAITGLTSSQVELLFGVKTKDFVPLSAFPTIQAIAAGQIQGPLSPNQILTKKEVKKIKKNIKKFNKKLEELAEANDWAFVDINGILADYDANGVAIPTVGTLTTGYLGGLFSLDGVHPTRTGHALLAAAMIQGINAKYGTAYALPDIVGIASTDPLVCNVKMAEPLTVDQLAALAPAGRAVEQMILGRRAD